MDSYIDLKNITVEELKQIDLDRVNVNCSPPDFEPQRQYYFMAKCRQIVKSESERLGRPLYACTVTFGCQMNARDSEKLSGILEAVGYELTETEEADFVIYNTCTVRDNANQRVYGRLGHINSLKKKNPHMRAALCGCMMQEPSVIEKIRKSYRFVDLIFGTHNIFKFAQARRGPRLRAGMTLAIEPMINMGRADVEWENDDWTVVTEDGSLSAHYENTILITEGEPEILTLY